MLVEFYYPKALSAARLDRYLAGGWFRNCRMLFRTKLLCLDKDFYSVVNIRLKLQKYRPSKSLRKILNRNDKRFEVVIRPASIDSKKEKLYQDHKNRFKGFLYGSLEDFFYGEVYWEKDIFNTYEVCVFDDDKLIALSYFDKGNKSVASLLGVYDSAYNKHSLGTYTMLKEVEYSIGVEMKYYYPGYVLNKNTAFDYKLRLGKMQYYDWNGHWHSMDNFPKETLLADILRTNLEEVESIIQSENIQYQRLLYPPFPIAYLEQRDLHYLQSPVFLLHKQSENSPYYFVIEYLLEEELYMLSRVRVHAKFEKMKALTVTPEFLDTDLYCLDLLYYDKIIAHHKEPQKIVDRLLMMI